MNILSQLFPVNLNYAKLKQQQSNALKLQVKKMLLLQWFFFNNSEFLYLPTTNHARGAFLFPGKASRNSCRELVNYRLQILMFPPGSCQEWPHTRNTGHWAGQLKQLEVKYLVQWHIRSCHWISGGFKAMNFMHNLSSPNYKPTLTLLLTFPCLFFPISHTHTDTVHQPSMRTSKGCTFCSYLFICFGCFALWDSKVQESVVFYQSFLSLSVSHQGLQSQYQREFSKEKDEDSLLCTEDHT